MSLPKSPIIAIPARLGATRLPGKPLADIHGEPMIVHVWRRAVEADIGPVVVACAEAEIADAVRFILQAPAMTGQMIALDGGQHLGWAQRRRTDTPAPED